jgi:hypothetical protein
LIGKTAKDVFIVDGFVQSSISDLTRTWSTALESQLAEEVTA